MTTRTIQTVLLAIVVAASLAALAGCSGSGPGSVSSPAAVPSPSPPPAAGAKLAPGLHDLEDGIVQAVGVVEYRDLEGGFWAVVGEPASEGDAGKIVAVLVNGADYARQFKDHEGLSMIVTGRRLDGASTRMAGPEIEATGVIAASDAGAPAE